ncbi:hypothetical protein JCM15765_07090 [Paradesulfitobacterium aromaticivorans]
MSVGTVGVVGAGTMGTGIAHMAAMSGYNVILRDIEMSYVERAVASMDKFMARSVEKGIMTEEARQATLARIKKTTTLEDMAATNFVIEVVLEKMDLKKAARLLQEGVASVEDIDTAVKLGLNYPMGPFELMDFTGIDIGYFVMEYFADEFRDNQYAAPQIIKQMVRANKLGRKNGEGFYQY